MVTTTFLFWIVLILTTLSVISLLIGFFIPLSNSRNDRENLIGGGIIGLVAIGLLGWFVGFCSVTAYRTFTLIPNENIMVHKTPVTYVVDFDKEEMLNYDTLEKCNLLDEKETLYFYKVSDYNHYKIRINSVQYVFLRKPYVTEQEEN